MNDGMLMLLVAAVFAILMIHDIHRLNRKQEKAKVYAIYFFMMGVSLTVSLLLAAGKKPSSPAQWIEAVLKIMGVLQ